MIVGKSSDIFSIWEYWWRSEYEDMKKNDDLIFNLKDFIEHWR